MPNRMVSASTSTMNELIQCLGAKRVKAFEVLGQRGPHVTSLIKDGDKKDSSGSCLFNPGGSLPLRSLKSWGPWGGVESWGNSQVELFYFSE